MTGDRHAAPTGPQGVHRTPAARATTGADRGSLAFEHGFAVAPNAATVQALLAGADRGSAQRLIASLQRMHGNAAVQRLIGGGLAVQRWAVGLPRGTSDCAVVVNHMNANSPYRATSGWARTQARFSWGGDPAYTEADGVITATVTNPTVTKTVNVDMPTWAPTDPAMARAWGAMIADLRAHETRHEGIATTWETTLRTNLAALSVTVPNRQIASFRAAVQAEWDGWLALHQADQTAIDPYTAILDCSGGESEGEASIGGGTEPDLSGLEGEPDLTG